MRRRLFALAEAMMADPRFEVFTFYLGPQVAAPQVDDLLDDTPFAHSSLPSPAIDTLADINGFHLEWILRDTAGVEPLEPGFPDELSGRIWLYDPHEIVGMNLTGVASQLVGMEPGEEQNPFPYFPIDYFHPDYSGCVLWGSDEHRTIAETLEIHLNPYGFFHSTLTVEDYLEILLCTAGLRQGVPGVIFPEGIERRMLAHYLPQLFGALQARRLASPIL